MALYASATEIIRASSGISSPQKTIRVSIAVNPLVMMSYGLSDFGVRLDVGENPLTDHWMLLHLPAFIERERPGLLKQPRRQSDLADVMYEASKMHQTLVLIA